MFDRCYLAWRYLSYHRLSTGILIGSLTLVAFLPIGLETVVQKSAAQFRDRAITTPLVLGAKTGPLELVLNSLYFETEPPPTIGYGEVIRIESSGLAEAIPLHTVFRCEGFPIVGTSLDYLKFRGLQLAEGQPLIRLGDCLLGASVATALQRGPGDTVISSPEGVFDIAGSYPLEMRVRGVLQPTGTADDRAVFVDLKTAWVIAGLGHGHDDLSQVTSDDLILDRSENEIQASAAVFQFNRITDENIDEFHFHGDRADFPITSALVVPDSSRSRDLLQGRYLDPNESVQLLRPIGPIETLLATVVRVKQFIVVGAAFVGLSTLLTTGLILALALRLRVKELRTMAKIGATTARIASLVAVEVGTVILATLLTTSLLVVLVRVWGDAIFRTLILNG